VFASGVAVAKHGLPSGGYHSAALSGAQKTGFRLIVGSDAKAVSYAASDSEASLGIDSAVTWWPTTLARGFNESS